MRQVVGSLINNPYEIFSPFRMIISGSSGKRFTTVLAHGLSHFSIFCKFSKNTPKNITKQKYSRTFTLF